MSVCTPGLPHGPGRYGTELGDAENALIATRLSDMGDFMHGFTLWLLHPYLSPFG
jgi:hypothetical protein